jgi:hypothetical protein
MMLSPTTWLIRSRTVHSAHGLGRDSWSGVTTLVSRQSNSEPARRSRAISFIVLPSHIRQLRA